MSQLSNRTSATNLVRKSSSSDAFTGATPMSPPISALAQSPKTSTDAPTVSGAGNDREKLQRKWDRQFEEIVAALAEARARNPGAHQDIQALTDDQARVQRMLDIMDLKNLALEGLESKLSAANTEIDRLREQLAMSNKLYFQSLVLNLKMHQLYAKHSAPKNIDTESVYEQCLAQTIPITQWPSFINSTLS